MIQKDKHVSKRNFGGAAFLQIACSFPWLWFCRICFIATIWFRHAPKWGFMLCFFRPQGFPVQTQLFWCRRGQLRVWGGISEMQPQNVRPQSDHGHFLFFRMHFYPFCSKNFASQAKSKIPCFFRVLHFKQTAKILVFKEFCVSSETENSSFFVFFSFRLSQTHSIDTGLNAIPNFNCTTLHCTYNYNHNHNYATLHYTTLDYTT